MILTYMRDNAEAMPHAVPRTDDYREYRVARNLYEYPIPLVPNISGVHLRRRYVSQSSHHPRLKHQTLTRTTRPTWSGRA